MNLSIKPQTKPSTQQLVNETPEAIGQTPNQSLLHHQHYDPSRRRRRESFQQTPPPAWHAVYPGPTERPLSPNEDTRSPGEGAQSSVTPREHGPLSGAELLSALPGSPPHSSPPRSLFLLKKTVISSGEREALGGTCSFSKTLLAFCFCVLSKTLT